MQSLLKSTFNLSRTLGSSIHQAVLFSTAPRSFIRFKNGDGQILFGQPEGDAVVGCKARVIEGDILKNPVVTDKIDIAKELLYPIEAPQIIAIGLNYKQHAEEAKLPVPKYPAVFIKTINSLNNPFDDVIIPKCACAKDETDFEGELAIVIRDSCKNVKEEDAMKHVLGYCIADDVSARRWQGKKGSNQWCRSKSFDTFTPLGPQIVMRDTIQSPNALQLKTFVNGKEMQNCNTSDMIFNVPSLISFLSQDTTLLPGTVIVTGTPGGVGFVRSPPSYLQNGDIIKIVIEQLGMIQHKVVNPWK
ncbi:hypothetical protein WA158_006176 [Blastocystis sp. Blastoise]